MNDFTLNQNSILTYKLCVKHKKSNVKTGKVVAKAMTWSFSVSNVFNEKRKSHVAILCALNFKYPNLPMSEVQLTKSATCLRSFPYVMQ